MNGGKKVRLKFNVTELRALDYFLDVSQSEYESYGAAGAGTLAQIKRLREKIAQMILQQRKFR